MESSFVQVRYLCKSLSEVPFYLEDLLSVSSRPVQRIGFEDKVPEGTHYVHLSRSLVDVANLIRSSG
jgi:hypothetical protein